MNSPIFSWYQMGPNRNLEDLSPSQLKRLRFTNKVRRNFAGNVKKIRDARDRDELICEKQKNILQEIESSSRSTLVKQAFILVVKTLFALIREMNGTAPNGRYAYQKCSE